MSVPHQAIVLCAGEGRRLRPFTARRPKPLLPFLNLPLLEHLLVRLRGAGVRRVACNAWHGSAALAAFGEAWRGEGLALEVRVERELLGTGGGLANLRDWLEPGPMLLLTSDVVADFDLPALTARHAVSRERFGAIATMALATRADTARFGAVACDDALRLVDVAGLLGRPGAIEAVNASAHVLEPAFVERLPAGPCCFVRQGYLPALADGVACAGWLHEGPWAEVGEPDAWLDAQRDALAGELPVDAALRARGGRLVPSSGAPSLVHASARLAADAVLRDGCVLGEGSEVGPGAVLERCLLLPGARVAPGSRLRRAIVDAEAP